MQIQGHVTSTEGTLLKVRELTQGGEDAGAELWPVTRSQAAQSQQEPRPAPSQLAWAEQPTHADILWPPCPETRPRAGQQEGARSLHRTDTLPQ